MTLRSRALHERRRALTPRAGAVVGLIVALGMVASSTRVVRAAANCSVAKGEALLDQGQYDKAIKEFSCVIAGDPTDVAGYRGRIEAELLLGRYSDAVSDYTRVTAYVVPVHPDAGTIVLAYYANRLAVAPNDVRAMMGASFARWWLFQYAQAIQQIDTLLAIDPQNLYGNLFRGSSRVLRGATPAQGIADLDHAIALAPHSPDVHFIVADAYTYGSPEPNRAIAEATIALEGGLDTPRVNAILASAWHALGDEIVSAEYIERHIELVTTEAVQTAPLDAHSAMFVAMAPGRTHEIPVVLAQGETLAIDTSSQDTWDTILVVLGPGGSPVVGSDDSQNYYAGLQWVAPAGGTYVMRVTSFEASATGTMKVTRK